MNRTLINAFTASVLFITANAWADGPTCNAAAAEKKLAGAAKTSFLKKCEKDAAATCDVTAGEKKLAGAAKSSFTKKCVKGVRIKTWTGFMPQVQGSPGIRSG